MDIKRDDYIFLDVTWETGFKHIVPCRGFNLTSQLRFSQSLDYVKSVTYRKVTQKLYEEMLCPSLQAADTESENLNTSVKSQSKRGTSGQKVGSKRSTTQASAKAATKSMKPKATSSTPSKKKSSGLKETKNEQRASKGKTLKENPAKGDSRTKAGKDSKAVSKPQRASKPAAKRASSSSKEARTELREPKVRNVRKPKKDVQGTNDSGKETLPRTRGRKAKTQ